MKKSCCNYDQRCPEWTVIKNKFIIVDDWNETLECNLNDVDEILNEFNNSKNASGTYLIISINNSFRHIHMQKNQLEKLKKDWADFKKKNPKLFKEE
ncbi:hypothetical protein EOM09_07205 [bacterium]|nr:hypothetical protein [bacterium]